ncbi:MAG TPA: hypothetical protein VN833_28860 [Candidatus Acidoferrales bacterium]|nr:hypothetical protein [Candidatus Acidoferrales bacterium]
MFIQPTARFFVFLLLASSVRIIASAQQAQPPDDQKPQAQSTPAQTTEKPKDTEPKVLGTPVPANTDKNPQDKDAGTSNDRLFFTLPNFLTLENSGQVPPLTTKQKYKVVARSSFDYVLYPWYGFLSAISQAENSEAGYGQGWEGYGKRFASAFADGTIENFLTAAVFPSVLHQDPRFFQSGKGGISRRTEYAVSRIFVTRTDSGTSQFNYSEVVGSALSAAISTNSYHPRAFITTRFDPTTGMLTYIHNASDRTLPNTLSVWGTQVGYDTITIVVKEFWPDIHRKLTHKKADAAPPGN